MQENNPKQNSEVEDLEMGSDPAPSQASGQNNVQVNKYTDKKAQEAPKVAQTNVDPKAQAPQAQPAQAQAQMPAKAAQTTPVKGVQQVPLKKGAKGPNPPNPASRKKALLGCLIGFVAVIIISLILSFLFLATAGAGESAFAKVLGIEQNSFINGLISFIYFVYFIIALTSFIFLVTGFFKTSMAKKEDKETKKEGMKMIIVAGVILLLISIIWVVTFSYLDSKRIYGEEAIDKLIVTDPEETTELTGPIEVKFDSSNIKIDDTHTRVEDKWDFGDESSPEYGQKVSHTYSDMGTYSVLLAITVEDKTTGELIEWATYSEVVSITDQAITASFTADPQSGEAPLEVEFDASESFDPNGNIERYEWDFNEDGIFDDAEGAQVSHEFTKIGNYTVELRVVNTLGDEEFETKQIIVEKGENPEAVITVLDEPDDYKVGQNYVFKADDSTSPNGNIVAYEWNFNDGSDVEETKSISHIFENEGTYEVTLKVTDEEDKEGEMLKVISIGAPQGSPKVLINSSPNLEEGDLYIEGKVPYAVIFDAKGTVDSDNNIIDYEWDFGDGSQNGYGETVSYTYTTEGTYTVTLTVTDADDNVGKDSMVVKVEPQGVVAIIETDQIDGSVPLTVEFDASGSTYSNGQITSYKWDFGDGSEPKLGSSTVSHRYDTIGSFTASVEVTGADNNSETAEITITVREIALTSCFVTIFEKGVAPLETTFDPGCSTGTATSYFWDFGDGNISTSHKPTHVFEEPGEYRVTLEITDSDNTVDKSEVFIEVTGEEDE